MKTSQNGYELIKAFEGLHKVKSDGMVRAYRCPAGKWTIGWGHTKGVKSGMTATPAECEEFLKLDVEDVEYAVNRRIKVAVTQNQLDAIVSFVFNVGVGNFERSTLLRKLNTEDYDGAAAQFVRWNKARVDGDLVTLSGLTRRRTAEAALFEMDVEIASEGNLLPPQKVELADSKPLSKSRTIWGVSIAGASTALNEITSQLQPLLRFADSLTAVFVLVTLIGLGFAAYARYTDHLNGVK